ncbi:MAG: OmpA family protein [Actinomycetota bacterium]
MAELFEEVVGVLESRPSTRSLAGQFRINSEKTAGNGAVLGVPVFIADLCNWAADPARSVSLLKILRTIDTDALGDMGRTIESRRYEPVGSELVELLLGDRRPQVASVISGEIGISDRSASQLLPPAAWALMASIADRYGSRIDRQSLLAILAREQSDLVNAGWGPWLEATGDTEAPPVVDQQVAAGRQRLPEAVEAGYPLPVSRHDRAAGGDVGGADGGGAGRPAVERGSLATVAAASRSAELSGPRELTRSAELTGTGSMRHSGSTTAIRSGGAGTAVREPVMSVASITGQLDLEELDRAADFLDTPLPDVERSPLPAILGALALIGLIGGAVYWFLLRDDTADDQAAFATSGTETTTVEDGAFLDTEDTQQLTAQSLDPMAIDLALRDPQARSSATGIAELRFNPDDGEVCYNVTAQNIGTPFQGFINVGPVGIQGTALVDLGWLENAGIGCTPVGPVEMAAIVADPAGHYVEILDPSGAFTIRAQLSEEVDGADLTASGAVLFDPAGPGAGATVEPGSLILTGEVADQVAFDFLSMEFNDLVAQGLVEVTNDLSIVPDSPAPSGQFTMTGDLFAISSAQLSDTGLASVETLAQVLIARPDWGVTIIGHTDATGDEQLNLQLSQDRAAAVRDALIAAGVVDSGIQTTGVGSSDPVADNSTRDGRAQNRRIELQVVR